jgi:hypothetical protein
MLTPSEKAARQIELVEAELAVLKQELVLQHLIDTREPSEEARIKLAKLREVVQILSDRGDRTTTTQQAA